MTDKTDTGPIEFDWDGLRRTVLVGVYMGGELTEWRNATPADLRAAGFIRKPTPEPGEPVGGWHCIERKCQNRATRDMLCDEHQPVPAETAGELAQLKGIRSDLERALGAAHRDLDRVKEERDDAQSALTRAEGRVREVEAELDQVCDVLYHTGATRGDALTRAKRAKNTYKELINESADRDEAIEGALRELDSVVSTARERAPSIVYGAINVARSRLRAQPPLASSVVADEATGWPRCGFWFKTDGAKEQCCKQLGHGGRHSLCGQPCPLLADYCPDCRVNGDKPPADEPSPLTGEEGKAERVDYVTRAELIAALREVGADADVPTSNALFELRKLLESRAAKGGSDGR